MSLVEPLDTAIKAMHWLTAADAPAIELAYTYARQIDLAVQTMDGTDLTKALYLGSHLQKTLAELGATPAGRKVLELEAVGAGGNLDQLRTRRARKAAEAG